MLDLSYSISSTSRVRLNTVEDRGVDPFFSDGGGGRGKSKEIKLGAQIKKLNIFLHYILLIFQVVGIIGGGGERYVCPPPNIFIGGDCPPPPPRINAKKKKKKKKKVVKKEEEEEKQEEE